MEDEENKPRSTAKEAREISKNVLDAKKSDLKSLYKNIAQEGERDPQSVFKNIKTYLTGNRLFALGLTLFTSGITADLALNLPGWQDVLLNTAYLVGGGMIGVAELGTETFRIYSRSKKHIEEKGELDKRFAEEVIKKDKSLYGYCGNQGLYLAAKEYDQLEVYEQAKEQYSENLIPNF